LQLLSFKLIFLNSCGTTSLILKGSLSIEVYSVKFRVKGERKNIHKKMSKMAYFLNHVSGNEEIFTVIFHDKTISKIKTIYHI